MSQERERKKNDYLKAKTEIEQTIQRAKLDTKTVNQAKYSAIKNERDPNLAYLESKLKEQGSSVNLLIPPKHNRIAFQ